MVEKYIWQHEDWPKMYWDDSQFSELLADVILLRETVLDRYTDGVVEVMIDATSGYDEDVDSERLFAWHAALFPMGRSGMYKINVGKWRNEKEAMQV